MLTPNPSRSPDLMFPQVRPMVSNLVTIGINKVSNLRTLAYCNTTRHPRRSRISRPYRSHACSGTKVSNLVTMQAPMEGSRIS